MKMRRIVLLAGFLLAIAVGVEAQVYAKFYAGYSAPLAGMAMLDPSSSVYSVMVYPMDNYDIVESNATYKQHFVSLGQGIEIKGALGMDLTDNLGAEVDFGFLMGDKIEASHNSKMTIGGILLNSSETFSYQASMVQIAPMVVLHSDVNFANLFVKFGPVMNTGVIKGNYFSQNNFQTVEREVKFTGGLSIGMTSTLGASIDLTDNLSLFAEMQVMTLSHSPDKAKVVKYEVNGSDNLSNLAVEDKEYIFRRTFDQDLSVNHPDNEPTELLKIRFPLSGFGIHVGVQMSF